MSPLVLSLVAAAAIAPPAPTVDPQIGYPEPPPVVRHQLEEGASKRAAFDAHRRSLGAQTKSWAEDLPAPAFDVTHYELDLHVAPSRQVLTGSVTVDLTAIEDGLHVVRLDADLGLRVLSVLQLEDPRFAYDTPRPLGFSHTADGLDITLRRPLAAGEAVRLQVTYGGHAWRHGLIGATGVNWYSIGGTPVIHTFAQPYGARVWWPCHDRPDDKATVTLRVTVPEGLDVAANGLERSYIDNGDGTSTSVWSSVYPVSTYLVVMHISDFAYSESTYTGLDGTTMPVGLWAMPAVADQAEADLAICVPQMEVMAERWGEYPFLEEKYGNATVFFGGGMEHQTMTTLAVNYVGDPWMEWLNVHEMGHQWWGDWVTMDDWRDTWLNEGLATHTEWLWAEHLGPDVLAQYLVDEDYLGQFSGPVYDNPEPFSWTIYAKGSWVAWMLRHVIGDDAFFAGMAAYRAAHAGGTATTEDLRAAMEDAAGTDLGWFFDQWVYGAYRPRYITSWEPVAGPAVELTVRQVQTNTGLFRMPMTVGITTASGDEEHRVWLEAEADQTVVIPTAAAATAVELNPDTGVLCYLADASEPDLDLGPDFPDGYDFGVVPGTATASKVLPLTNVGGADLVVADVAAANTGMFTIADPPVWPAVIPPGDTLSLEIVFDPSGLGPVNDWLVIQSNDPDLGGLTLLRMAGTGTLFEPGRLAVPASTSIGRTPLGGISETGFDALNLGGEPLAVLTTVAGDGFSLASAVPTVLEPGSSTEVRVRFHPTGPGDAAGEVIFSDPLDTTWVFGRVRLTGTATGAPRLELRPAAVTLGVGDGTGTATLTAANTGTEDLAIALAEAGAPFELVGGAAPVVVPAGSAHTFTIGLDGSASGTLTGRLTIHSDDPSVPVANVPLRAHVTDDPVQRSSFPAAANGPGLDDTRWATRAYLLNPGGDPIRTDLVFRPGGERLPGAPDAGLEVPSRSQRVIRDLVGAAGAAGTGGVNLTSAGDGLVAVARIFAAGDDGSYGQFIAATDHDAALDGDGRYLLAGLAGNDGFHTNIGVLNLGGDPLAVDYWFHDTDGGLIGTRRVTAAPGAFAQVVSVIGKLTGTPIRGGYATFTAASAGARYLAYASVVDDGSHDPTLVTPQRIDPTAPAVDLVIPAAAALPGAGGTSWRSQLDVVNAAGEARMVTVEFTRADGSAVASMPMELAAGTALHFDDVVGGLFGEVGKGWLRVTGSGNGLHAASRTYNDDAAGTYGQLIPAVPIDRAVTGMGMAVLPGLSSEPGFRTNLGVTSMTSVPTSVTVTVFADDGAVLGELPVTLPPWGFVQLERVLADALGHRGTAWAVVSGDDAAAAYFAHASVVDEATGDPTYIPAVMVGNGS